VPVHVAAATSEVTVGSGTSRALGAAALALLGVLPTGSSFWWSGGGGGDCELVGGVAVSVAALLVLLHVVCCRVAEESSRGKHSESTKCSVMASKKPRRFPPPLGLFIKMVVDGS
jgi:hypothetical protein